MNRTYDEKALFFSDSGIYMGSSSIRVAGKKRTQPVALLLALIGFLTSVKVRIAWKVAMVALCLVGMIGIVGGMETGVLSLPLGLFFGLILVGAEFFCLRRK